MLETYERLAEANAALCREHVFLTGLAKHSLDQYDAADRRAAARAFGLADGEVAVLAVAPGRAADRAGLRAGDQLVSADGTMFEAADGGAAALDTAFVDGDARIDVLRGGQALTMHVTAPRGCAGSPELVLSDAYRAAADGSTVRVNVGMVRQAVGDELAAVIAHELAHNILRHRERLNAAGVSWGMLKQFGRNARMIRATEIEADRLSIYLLDSAGYDPGIAARFWRRYGPSRDYGIFNAATHPGWKKRVASLDQEVATLARLKQQGGEIVPPLLQGPLPPLD